MKRQFLYRFLYHLVIFFAVFYHTMQAPPLVVTYVTLFGAAIATIVYFLCFMLPKGEGKNE